MEQVLQNEASYIVKTVGFNRVQSDLLVSIAILYIVVIVHNQVVSLVYNNLKFVCE